MQESTRKANFSHMSAAAKARALGMRHSEAYWQGFVSEPPDAHPLVQGEAKRTQPDTPSERQHHDTVSRIIGEVAALTSVHPAKVRSDTSDNVSGQRGAVCVLATERGVPADVIGDELAMTASQVHDRVRRYQEHRAHAVTRIVEQVRAREAV